jgi:hypothetical protein
MRETLSCAGEKQLNNFLHIYIVLYSVLFTTGARGTVVVKALCRGFET